MSGEMSGTVLGGELPDSKGVCRLVADRVVCTPGVARLEPSLEQSLSRIAGQAGRLLGRQVPAAADGVSARIRGGDVEVDIDVVIDTKASIVRLGDEIRTDVKNLLTAAGFAAITVNVAVLGVDD